MSNRRVLIGLRNTSGAAGIFVSKPGFNANDTDEAHLLFSSDRRHFMLVQSGGVVLGGAGQGVFVPFYRTLESVPFVLCGVFNPKPSRYPVSVSVFQSGFLAYPAPDPFGGYPAAGITVGYYAFLKNQQ